MTLSISSLDTPIGRIHFIAEGQVLLGLNFSNIKALTTGLAAVDFAHGFKDVARIPGISDLLTDYFDGDITALDLITSRQPGTPFLQAAWRAMRDVRGGTTISYANLAERAGHPAAARAAGSACAKNTIALVVPCHRIVKTGGLPGNYAYGLKRKEWLLRHEGAV